MNLDKYVKTADKSSKKVKKTKIVNSEEIINQQIDSNISENDYLLLSVTYNGESRKAIANLYGQKKLKQHFDSSGHLPYLLSNLTQEEIEKNYPKVKQHEGFEKFEKINLENLVTDKKIDMIKVIANDPLSVGGKSNSIRELLKGYSWEDKIRYHNCYIYDTGLIPGLFYNEVNGNLIKKEYQIPKDLEKQVMNLFSAENEEFRKTSLKIFELFITPIPKIERVAFDIEVASRENRIPNAEEAEEKVICVSFLGTDGFKKVLLLEREGIEEGKKIEGFDVEIQKFKGEKELLMNLFKILNEYPVVMTFNGDNFDLKYLYHRAIKKLKIPKEEVPIILGREIALLKNGIHIDLYKFFHNRAIQVSAFSNKYRQISLDEVGKALLKIPKVKLDKFITDLANNDLAYYCFNDSQITLGLTQFNNNLVMNLIILLMRISKLSMEDVTRQGISSWLQNLFYFEHRQRKYLIPNPEYILEIKGQATSTATIKGKKYQGAKVMDPVPGIFFNVVVLDFASLYPSVIQRYNLSYETIKCPHKECKTNLVPNTPYWVCTKKIGLSALLIGLLKELRVKWFKPKVKDENLTPEERNTYDVIQFALKVIVNAAYGVFGFENFPLYCPPVADATAAGGRFAIEKTIDKAKELNIHVLYGDTDSVFLDGPSKEQINELIDWSKKELEFDLDVDKVFRWVALSARKKNYLGVFPNGVIDIKGLSGKKSNTPIFVQKLFYEMTQILSEVQKKEDIDPAKEKIKKLVKTSLTKLKKKEYSIEELAFRIVLTHSPAKYEKTTPQHVKAARQLQSHYQNTNQKKEIQAGDIIYFVKTKNKEGVKPIQLANPGEIDTDKYRETMESTFDQVLDALGISFDELTGTRTLDFFIK